ncbi:MAG: MinD/ParA family protein [Alphaproteobacteria bacterium]
MTDPIPLNAGAPAALRVPNLYAVASGKGGVGKTWFSISLCHALAARGKKVLLFDGDLGLANIDIQLGLTPAQDLGAVIDGRVTLAGAITPYAEGKFDVLAGRSGSGNLASLPTQKLNDLRADLIALARNYDHVVVDLGAGVDRSVRYMAGPAAIGFVVVNDEPTSLTDAYAFIKLVRAANPQADLRITVNMAANQADGTRTYETIKKACENFLHYAPPLAGIIRRDNKVREAIRAQTSIFVRSPEAEAATDVTALVNQAFGK